MCVWTCMYMCMCVYCVRMYSVCKKSHDSSSCESSKTALECCLSGAVGLVCWDIFLYCLWAHQVKATWPVGQRDPPTSLSPALRLQLLLSHLFYFKCEPWVLTSWPCVCKSSTQQTCPQSRGTFERNTVPYVAQRSMSLCKDSVSLRLQTSGLRIAALAEMVWQGPRESQVSIARHGLIMGLRGEYFMLW